MSTRSRVHNERPGPGKAKLENPFSRPIYLILMCKKYPEVCRGQENMLERTNHRNTLRKKQKKMTTKGFEPL
jgi:hypothetical protein